MKVFVLLLLSFSLSQSLFAQKTIDPSHKVPIEKNLSVNWKKSLYSDGRKEYKGEELLTIGMPCGGIAAGQLYVRGDGTLANWWISNNAYNTGYGIDSLTHFNTALGPWTVCYHSFEPPSYISQGFALTIHDKKGSRRYELSKKDFNDISFTGEYPLARIKYASKQNKLPVAVRSEVFSPFIPSNAKESATPATILRYTISNTSAAPVSLSLDGWLQNLVCLDIAPEIIGNSHNVIVKEKGMGSLVMDLQKGEEPNLVSAPRLRVFDDFESGYAKWTVDGEAFGNAPAQGSFKGDQSKIEFSGKGLVNSFLNGDSSTGSMKSESFVITDSFIVFKIGGGKHPKTTCVNLVVDNKVVRNATGSNTEGLNWNNWNVGELKGKTAHIEIIDKSRGGWGHINVDDISFSDKAITKPKYFPGSHPYFGNLSLSILSNDFSGDADFSGAEDKTKTSEADKPVGKPLVGSIGTRITLQPGETRTVDFLLTWYFPNRPSYYFGSDVTDIIPNDWNQVLPSDQGTIIGNMYSNWYSSSRNVAQYLKKNFKRLTDETMRFHKTYYENNTLPYWLVKRTLMPLSILATETCQWWANDKFWAWEGVGSCVGTCTHVWNYEQALAHFFPSLERNIREKTDFGESFQKDGSVLARNGWGGVLIDGHAGSILKGYREHLNSRDELFLRRNWDRIKRATEFIINEDENQDGLIEKKQANTYDIAFYGANTYVGSLYLAALQAAAKMAGIMNDTAFAKKCTMIAEAGSANTVKNLWNGEYFVQDVNLKDHPEYQYATGCLSDQLFGQTWNHLNNLGYLYPKYNVQKALQSIWRYNWTADVGVQNSVHPPERTYADKGEPGLFVCTWPYSAHMGETGVRYRDEVWTGIEYQVATNMIYEGMTDEGLSLIRSVDERYSPAKHNPWNEIECGDHYARAMASWGVMMAVQDYYYNGPEKILSYDPKIKAEDFSSFFNAAEGWGNIQQKRQGKKQVNVISLRYGTLALRQLEFGVEATAKNVFVTAAGKNIKSSFTNGGNKLIVSFDQVDLVEGENLTIEIQL